MNSSGSSLTHWFNFSEPIDLFMLDLGSNRTSKQSFIHSSLDLPENVINYSLLIPRVLNASSVYVCPDATTIEEVSATCSNVYSLGFDQTIQGTNLLSVQINGKDYYEVSGSLGTGGGEGNPPTLTNLAVSPTSGDDSQLYNFTINYTDIENDSAGLVRLELNGANNYSMSEANFSDTDVTNGKIYYYETTLVADNYSAKVFAKDEANVLVNSSTILAPNVSQGSTPGIVDVFVWTSDNNYTNQDIYCNFTEVGSTTTSAVVWDVDGAYVPNLYLPMKGGSSNALLDVSFNNNSASCTTTCPTFNVSSGPQGFGGLNFAGSPTEDYFEYSDGPLFDITNLTLAVWIKTNSITETAQFVLEKGLEDDDSYGFGVHLDELFLEYNNTEVHFETSSNADIVVGDWTHIAWRVNGSTLDYFVDGVNVETDSLPELLKLTNYDVRVGSQRLSGSTYGFDGDMAELMFFNRSLSDDQIVSIYSSSLDIIVSAETTIGDNWTCSVIPFDNTSVGSIWNSTSNITVQENPPVVNLVSPFNNFIDNGGISVNITFVANATDDLGLMNCSLWTNTSGSWEKNLTNTVSGLSNETSFLLENISEGSYVWNVNCMDNNSNRVFAISNRSFSVDAQIDTIPYVVLTNPSANYENDATQFVHLNFSANVTEDKNLTNCSLWTNSTGVWQINETKVVSGTSASLVFEKINLNQISFIWNIACYDNASQESFAFDNRSVLLNWIYPPEVIPGNLNATSPFITDSDNLTCNYGLNGSAHSGVVSWRNDGAPYALLQFPFDGNESNALLDFSGNSYHAVASENSPVWKKNASKFDIGVFKYAEEAHALTIENVSEFNSPTAFTVMAKVLRDVDYSSDGYNNIYFVFFSKPNFAIGTGSAVQSDPGDIEIFLDTAGTDSFTYDANFQTNLWYDIAVTYDSSDTNELKLYLNGSLVQEWSTPSGSVVSSLANISVGEGSNGDGNWHGYIDCLYAFNRSISPEEIAEFASSDCASSNVLVSNATSPGDNWSCVVNAFSYLQKDEPWTSNYLWINPDDTCSYLGTGDWIIDCADNCSFSTPVDVGGNDVSIIGHGNIVVDAVNISNFQSMFIQGESSVNRCEVYCVNGGCFSSN